MTLAEEDPELLLAWSQGDTSAGEVLVRRHVGALYGFFRNKLTGDVDDVVQRTFLACVEAVPSFRYESSFRAFLFGIARNTLLMELRKRYRTPDHVELESASIFELSDASEPTIPTEFAARREQVLLLRALRRLSVDEQIALELAYWEDMPGVEIAQVLGRPHATVRTQLRRARLRLHELIAEVGENARLVTSTTDRFDHWVEQIRNSMARAPGSAVS